jgi:hypothetical protein
MLAAQSVNAGDGAPLRYARRLMPTDGHTLDEVTIPLASRSHEQAFWSGCLGKSKQEKPMRGVVTEKNAAN